MYTGLLDIHSFLRYVALFLLLAAVVKAFAGWAGKKEYTTGDRKLSLFSMITCHLQLVIGLWLYFISPAVQAGMANMGEAMKDKALRFWTVEHIGMMVIAVALITIGNSLAKKTQDSTTKHKRIAVFFLIGLILILASIPWPFSSVARAWF